MLSYWSKLKFGSIFKLWHDKKKTILNKVSSCLGWFREKKSKPPQHESLSPRGSKSLKIKNIPAFPIRKFVKIFLSFFINVNMPSNSLHFGFMKKIKIGGFQFWTILDNFEPLRGNFFFCSSLCIPTELFIPIQSIALLFAKKDIKVG